MEEPGGGDKHRFTTQTGVAAVSVPLVLGGGGFVYS